MLPGLHVEDAALDDAPAAIDQDLVEAAEANPVELVGRGSRRLASQLAARTEARLVEEPPIRGIRRRIEITRDQDRIRRITRGDPIQDQPDRPEAGRLRQVGVEVVDPETTSAPTVAEPDPGADPLGSQQGRRGWRVGRFLQPERAAAQFLEAIGVEVDRAVLAGRPAVISADPDAAMSRQHARDGLDLFGEGLLHAQDIRP